MTDTARKIPESVSGQELEAAMAPLFQLLGVDPKELFLHGLHFDFADGITIVSGVPTEAGLTATNPGAVGGNEGSEYAIVSHVRLT